MTQESRGASRKERGQAAVEFALVLPIVLMMIFGIIEFGRVIQGTLTANHCANELARYAVTGRTVPEIITYAFSPENPICPPIDLQSEGSVLTVEIGYPDWAAGDQLVDVRVEYRIDLVVPIIRDLFPDGVYWARGRATMCMERVVK
jgi:hypothetical protein